ncbi:MAG TPA: NAD(P)/FAD-dependent oxidoreductase [Spirochaetia bacterium]|nr:NAD(P)/FAD-dependent oxidoreductase [Spirochaetia bacterium]
MKEKVIIIGAGVYGLSLGSYLAMNDLDVEILEMHNAAGGVCTSWKRGGYTFDGCIHWLMGSGPGSGLHELWKELHAVQGRRFVEWEEYATVRTRGGERFTVYTDPDRLEAEMLRIGPQDARTIRELCDAIARMSRVDIPVGMETMSLSRKISAGLGALPMLGAMRRWGSVTFQSFCARLKSPALAEALRCLYGAEDDMPDFPVMGLIMMLAFMHKKTAGYAIGGSREFAHAIEQRFCELGGTIRYGTRVDRIIVEGNRAVGVASGMHEHRADVVVSCADGHATLYGMLGGRYLSPRIRTAYGTYQTFPAPIYTGIGIARDLRDTPALLLFPLRKEMVLEDGALRVNKLSVRLFSFDPTMAPAGKTAATVMITTRNHEYWTRLRAVDPGRYRQEKSRIGELIVDALDQEIGDIQRHVEVVDVSTPATWIRYTGNWKGSFEGFLPTRKTMMQNLGFTLPGLRGFYMNGHWVSVGGGLPPAAMNGRTLARMICRDLGKEFEVVA